APEAACAVGQQARTGGWSQKLVRGDRLPLKFLDTLGVVYRKSGHADEAVAVFREAVQQRYKNEPLAYLHLGRSYAQLKETRDADAAFEAALRLAAQRAGQTADPERKKKFDDLAEDARAEQRKLQKVGR